MGILKTIKDIFLFMPRLTYFICIRPLVICLAKNDIEEEKKRYKKLIIDYQKNNKQLKEVTEKHKKSTEKTERIESIFEYWKKYSFEVMHTKHNELTFIFSGKNKLIGEKYLMGSNGQHGTNDSKINVGWYIDGGIIIYDIISNTTKRGYARTLLEYTIKKAKEKGCSKIYGKLSSVDSDSFDWLIPFYESLGFKCTLFKDKKNGEAILDLNTSNDLKKHYNV